MRDPELGRRLRNARQAKGLTLVEVVIALKQKKLIDADVSQATIQRIEAEGLIPTLPLFVALAEIYGKKLKDLSPMLAAQVATLRDLLDRSAGCLTAA